MLYLAPVLKANYLFLKWVLMETVKKVFKIVPPHSPQTISDTVNSQFLSVTCQVPTYENTIIDAKYPPTPGSSLEVKCTAGHVNTGSQTITCQEDGTWGWEKQPECQKIGKILARKVFPLSCVK